MRCRGAACRSRRCTGDSCRVSIQWQEPIVSVAALTAQPLAALPPYGCGVPFTGGERLWQLHISARLRRPCNAPGLSLRGAKRRGNLAGPGWITGQLRRIRKLVREIATGAKRPRNDNSEVYTILTMACTDRQHCAGPGCPLPYNGVYGRREYPEICSCQWRSLPVKGTPHP